MQALMRMSLMGWTGEDLSLPAVRHFVIEKHHIFLHGLRQGSQGGASYPRSARCADRGAALVEAERLLPQRALGTYLEQRRSRILLRRPGHSSAAALPSFSSVTRCYAGGSLILRDADTSPPDSQAAPSDGETAERIR